MSVKSYLKSVTDENEIELKKQGEMYARKRRWEDNEHEAEQT